MEYDSFSCTCCSRAFSNVWNATQSNLKLLKAQINGLARQSEILISWKEHFRLLGFVIGGRTHRTLHCGDSYPDTYLLQHCKCTRSIKKLHAQIITGGFEQNPLVFAKLVGKYVECSESSMEAARKVFDKLPERDVVVWNMVIQGYANVGLLLKPSMCMIECGSVVYLQTGTHTLLCSRLEVQWEMENEVGLFMDMS